MKRELWSAPVCGTSARSLHDQRTDISQELLDVDRYCRTFRPRTRCTAGQGQAAQGRAEEAQAHHRRAQARRGTDRERGLQPVGIVRWRGRAQQGCRAACPSEKGSQAGQGRTEVPQPSQRPGHLVRPRPAATLAGRVGQAGQEGRGIPHRRSEEHKSELQSLMRIWYAVFCLKKKKKTKKLTKNTSSNKYKHQIVNNGTTQLRQTTLDN